MHGYFWLSGTVSCDHGWMHVNADWVVLEPVDADYRRVRPGEQSHTLLLTNLANCVQPILRYDLGDTIVVRPERCPCGNPLPDSSAGALRGGAHVLDDNRRARFHSAAGAGSRSRSRRGTLSSNAARARVSAGAPTSSRWRGLEQRVARGAFPNSLSCLPTRNCRMWKSSAPKSRLGNAEAAISDRDPTGGSRERTSTARIPMNESEPFLRNSAAIRPWLLA